MTTELRLIEVLAELAAERARVLLVSADGRDAVAGELRAVGYDVVTVRTDGDAPATAYVPRGQHRARWRWAEASRVSAWRLVSG